jgi:hypothetical protein
MQVALQIERIGDILLIEDRVEGEAHDRALGPDVFVEEVASFGGRGVETGQDGIGARKAVGGKDAPDVIAKCGVEQDRAYGDRPAEGGDRPIRNVALRLLELSDQFGIKRSKGAGILARRGVELSPHDGIQDPLLERSISFRVS